VTDKKRKDKNGENSTLLVVPIECGRYVDKRELKEITTTVIVFNHSYT